MIKIGALLDSCGIVYTEKQLVKMEKLVAQLIETKILETIQKLDFGKKTQDVPQNQSKIVSNQNLSEEIPKVNNKTKVFAENMSTIKTEPNDVETFSSENLNTEESNIQDNIAQPQTPDIKFEVDEINSSVAKNVSKFPVKQKHSSQGSGKGVYENLGKGSKPFVCPDCNLGFNTQIVLDLHISSYLLCRKKIHNFEHHCNISLTHKCTWTQAERIEKTECPICLRKEKTMTRIDLFSHVEICEKVRKIGCPQCGKTFQDTYSLNNHISNYHKNLNCDICKIVFISNQEFKDHQEERHSKKACLLCKASLNPENFELHMKENHFCGFCHNPKVENITNHLENHKVTEEIKCKYCEINLTKVNFEEHVADNHYSKEIFNDVLVYHCNKCEENFKILSDIRNHILLVHEPNKLYNCEYCDKKFTTNVSLQLHVKHVHLKQNSETCEKCGTKLSTKESLQYHMLSKHGSPRKDFICDSCGKSFRTLVNLKMHKISTHVKNVQCDICLKWFGSEKLLEHHKSSHGEKIHNCLQCEKSFALAENLKRHVKSVHVRPHKCQECDYSCAGTSSLEFHMKTAHFTDKAYKCEKCGESFPVEEYLNSHIKNVHDNTRAFSCSVCQKTFASKEGRTGLDNHIARFHELKNVENCPYCGKQYSRLEAHSKRCSANPNLRRKTYECPNCNKVYQDKQFLNFHIKKKH